MTTDHTHTARERAENLALLSFPMVEKPNKKAFVRGFLARDAEAGTITAEQIEAAAYQIANVEGFNYHGLDAGDRDFYQHLAEVAFRAAGFRIEEAGA